MASAATATAAPASAVSFKVCGCIRRKFPMDASIPPDVEDAFRKFSDEKGWIGNEELRRFLAEVQGQPNVSETDANTIIDSALREARRLIFPILHRRLLDKDDFLAFLLSPNLNPPLTNTVHHDMTAPLSHYYINTGHNSYLTGNQLSSTCSEKPIVDALHRGVRGIELDIWPSSSNDTIMVFHGRTLTSPVKFERCIDAIRTNAFVASEYPLIITLEDHLTPELQAKVAKMVKTAFGDILLCPDPLEGMREFPSPESLKGRIIISTKPPKEYLAGKGKATEKVKEKVEDAKEEPWGNEIPDFADEFRAADDNSPGSIGRQHSEADSNDEEQPEKQEEPIVDPEYKNIIAIRAGKQKGQSIKDALKMNDEFVRRLTLSEPQLVKVAKECPALLIKFTQKNLLRIHPYGLRIDSSNYNPLVAWMHGAQMVAFNMQGHGRPLWLVQGMFRANGGCGYVKKPEFLLSDLSGSQAGNMKGFYPYESRAVKTILKVKVYMGRGWLEQYGKHHFDMFSPPDFYTRIGIAGAPADTIMKKTDPVEDNWTPHWNSEYEFPLTVPELALLRIEVHEYDMSDKDDFGGQTCLPVPELRPGFRAVPLFDKKGRELTHVRLLMRFEFIAVGP